MVKKKAQAAMEFLMTYGWAILVVLAAIAALAYFGVLSPDRFLPEKCTMPSGVACLDFSVIEGATVDTVRISLQNAAGFDMTNVWVNLTGDDSTSPGCTRNNGTQTLGSLGNGVKDTFDINCSNLPASGQKFKSPVVMTYTNAGTGLTHTKVGEVIVKMP